MLPHFGHGFENVNIIFSVSLFMSHFILNFVLQDLHSNLTTSFIIPPTTSLFSGIDNPSFYQ